MIWTALGQTAIHALANVSVFSIYQIVLRDCQNYVRSDVIFQTIICNLT